MAVEDDYTNSTSFTVSLMSAGVGALQIPAEVTLHYIKRYGGDVCRKILYAVIGPSPELFGAGETGRYGSFTQLFNNDISLIMQLRAVLATTALDKEPQISDVVCVDDQQYAIGLYMGNEAETEHGVLDDIAERVLLSQKFYSGLPKSTRSVATIKLGTLGAGNIIAAVNKVTGEEEAHVSNFNLRPAAKWTVRKIVYEDSDTLPNENPDYKASSIVLEISAPKQTERAIEGYRPAPKPRSYRAVPGTLC
jgi:hypothetical protein